MSLWNALVQAHRGNLHQQSGLFALVRQFEIAAHHGVDNEGPVQVIGASNGATRHQVILLATDHYWLRQLVIFCVSIERTGFSIEPHTRVGTHVDSAIQSWLQELNIKTKLILISPACCVIQIEVELPDIPLLSRRGRGGLITLRKQHSSTNYLHASTRSAKKTHHGFRQFLGQISYFNGFFVGLQVVHLQNYQAVVAQHCPVAFALYVISHKADSGQLDAAFPLCVYLSIRQSMRIHQMIHFTSSGYSILKHAVLDGCS